MSGQVGVLWTQMGDIFYFSSLVPGFGSGPLHYATIWITLPSLDMLRCSSWPWCRAPRGRTPPTWTPMSPCSRRPTRHWRATGDQGTRTLSSTIWVSLTSVSTMYFCLLSAFIHLFFCLPSDMSRLSSAVRFHHSTKNVSYKRGRPVSRFCHQTIVSWNCIVFESFMIYMF